MQHISSERISWKKALVRETPLLLPVAHDALSARIIEQAGFGAVQIGGFAVEGSRHGVPDIDLTHFAERYAAVKDIMGATSLPIMVDADDGYGDVKNVTYTVRGFEGLGIQALFLEDQQAPKECGHMDGKKVVPPEEMVGKLKSADQLETNRGSTQAARCLAEALAVDGGSPAIVGVVSTIETIASHYAEKAGVQRRLCRRYRAHASNAVVQPPPVSGTMRCCGETDCQSLSEFIRHYMVAIDEPPVPDAIAFASELIANRRIYIWCDPDPVAMAGWAGPTPNGIRINSVYTPPQFRNRGYASNLVAQLTQKLLDDGRRSVFLFTDQRNPSAERIYERIGYRRVSAGEHWTFKAKV